MITPEQKKQARISLLREAIDQLKSDLNRVQTDHGQTSLMNDRNEYKKELKALLDETSDLNIGDIVQTLFSGSERFEVYDVRTIRSERTGAETIEYKLNAFGNQDLKTDWFHKPQLIPVGKV